MVLAEGWAAEELEEISDMVLDVFMTCTVSCYLYTHNITTYGENISTIWNVTIK
jgi:hypothetical protein